MSYGFGWIVDEMQDDGEHSGISFEFADMALEPFGDRCSNPLQAAEVLLQFGHCLGGAAPSAGELEFLGWEFEQFVHEAGIGARDFRAVDVLRLFWRLHEGGEKPLQ